MEKAVFMRKSGFTGKNLIKKREQGLQRRVVTLFSIWAMLFTLLYMRVGYLSCSDQLLEAAHQQHRFTLEISESRNAIYDRNFTPLADTTSEIRYAVMPCPENQLPVLDAVPADRRADLARQFETGRPFLLRGADRIEAVGVEPFSVPVRTASPQLAPHLIGYLDDSGHGVCGIEQSFDAFLSESPAHTEICYQLNALGESLGGLAPDIRQEPRSARGVVLTLDANLQMLVENVGNRMLKKGAIVIMDPYTGKIRASASFPTYSPETLPQAMRDTENSPLINRALLPFSVGSTFKVVTAAAALEAGIPVEETYECTGEIDVHGQRMRCHKHSGHGELGMIDAMMKSCNPYFIHLGQEIGGARLLEMTKRFGFGEKLPLSGRIGGAAGTLPSPQELVNPAEIANLSFGQGQLTASPLQVTRMMAAACNGGLLVYPRLVEGKTMDGTVVQEVSAVPARRILFAKTAAQLQSMLIHCVMEEEGQNALPANVTAGGKTATAQTGRFREENDEIEHGWFSGFFPADAPRYVVTVLAEESGFGNGTAAPVFREIAEQITARGW